MEKAKWFKRVETLTRMEYASYAGVYQAYAWEQGHKDQPLEFRIPDQYFVKDAGEFVEGRGYNTREGFIVADFMCVVADMDAEGYIHMWKYRESKGDRFLTLDCTETASAREVEGRWSGDDYWFKDKKFTHLPS